jgi:hypothetical protein
MKTSFAKLTKGILILCVILIATFISTQAQFSPTNVSSVTYAIKNFTRVNDRTLEFDLYLINNDSIKPFELSIIQTGIFVNSEIINDGNIKSMVVPGFSDLVSTQQPTSSIIVKRPSASLLKVAPKICPGPGNGTKIKGGKGTRICRLRVTNTVPFAKAKANLTFCFTQALYPTAMFQYIGRVNTKVTLDSHNCINDTPNPVLNN